METRPHCNYRLRFYSCKADNHYHLVLGPGNVSWPFWSQDAGMRHVVMAEQELVADARSEIERGWVAAEIARLHAQVKKLHIPPSMLKHEWALAEGWYNFTSGKSSYINYEDGGEGGDLLPLYCDFVKRSSPRPCTKLTRQQNVRLAFAPAARLQMHELGIELEPIAQPSPP